MTGGQGHSVESEAQPEARIPVQKELAGLVTDFSTNTTLHGLGGLFKKRKTSNPFKWKNYMFLIAFFACLVILGYNLHSLATDYLKYPVTTSIVRERREFMEFPAITMCISGNFTVRNQLILHISKHNSTKVQIKR